MNQISKLVTMILSAIVFCMGISMVFYEAKTYNSTLQTLRELVKDEVIYQQYIDYTDEIVTYAELIAKLMQPLEYDLIINDLIITKGNHNIDYISSYHIKMANYSKSYRYDDNGTIISIVYLSKSRKDN